MATYATFAELEQRYGTAALTAMLPADASDPLATLAGQALEEAAAEIDTALGGCGYTVPVDTSVIIDAGQKARAIALLRRMEIGFAVAALSRGEEGAVIAKETDKEAGSISYSKRESDMAWAMRHLDMICARRQSIPGVSGPGRTFVRSSAQAVPAAADVSDRIDRAGAW